MKIAPFLSTIVAVCALNTGVGFAAGPSGDASKAEPRDNQRSGGRPRDAAHGKTVQTNGKPSKPKNDDPVSKTTHPGPLNFKTKHSPVNAPLQPELNKVGVAKVGPGMDKTQIHYQQPAKPLVLGGPVPSVTRTVHTHSATTASVGGLAASNVKNSPALVNGAGIKPTLFHK